MREARPCATILLALALASPVVRAEVQPPAGPTVAQLQTWIREGDYTRAEAEGRALLGRFEHEFGADSVEVAEVLDALLEARWRGGKATEPETEALGQRSLAIKRATVGPADAGVGKTLHHLAVVAFFRSDYPRASTLWEEAIAVREKALGASHPDVAESLNALANLRQRSGAMLEARALYDRALEIRKQAYGERDPSVGATLNNLTALLTTTGDYAQALPLAERSLAIKEATLGPRHPQVATTLINLGDLNDQLGDGARATEQWKRALSILEDTVGPKHRDVGSCLNNLAEQDRRVGRLHSALPAFERALRIWEEALGAQHPDVAIVLNNLSATHEALGDSTRARELQERAVAIREAGLGRDHPRLAVSLNNLAELLATQGDDARAGELYARALQIRRDKLGPQHPAVAESELGLGRVRARAGSSAEAFGLAIEAERVAHDHLRLTGRALSEQQALRYASALDRGLDLALTLAVEGAAGADARKVLDVVIRSRSVVLDEMAARGRSVSASANPEVRRLADELAAARSRLANLSVRGVGGTDPTIYRRLIDEARAEKEKLERTLGAASAEFAREQLHTRIGVDEVLEHLPEEAALVSFVQYMHSGSAASAAGANPVVPSYAAVVARGGATTVVGLGAAAAIDALVAGWKREAAAGGTATARSAAFAEAAYRRAGDALRRRIWDPLGEPLVGTGRVFVVPDGAINLVSFVALPTGEDSYLIETGPLLHYLSAERDLVLGPQPSGRGLLAIGGPDYDGTATFAALSRGAGEEAPPAPASGTAANRSAPCGSFAAMRFSPLPGAAREGDEIAALWRKTVGESVPSDGVALLSGAAATERALKQQAPGRRVVHVATHGFFLGEECGGGAGARGIKLMREEQPAEPTTAEAASPLLLSGVVLAGANHRRHAGAGEEDGILTAEEIAGLDLSGVEWAVLSGCDTGLGSIQAGEGVLGLRRAMQVAGARTLIMSLWPVDDQATREWMAALYSARLEQGLDTARAVRAAGLAVLGARRGSENGTHPSAWAAFVAAGDWR